MADLFKKFQLDCPELVQQMKACDHHWSPTQLNPYHLESETFLHTFGVCLIAEQYEMNDVVKIACVLHDVGKPMSTVRDEKSQKVKMYGHEGMSVFVGLKFLNSLGLSESEKVRVLQLVSWHTYLYKQMRGKSFEENVKEKFVRNRDLLEDLISVTKCDALGRFAETEDRPFWKDAENNLGHLLYKVNPHAQPRQNTTKEVMVLIGPPMSGKSTFVKEMGKGYRVVSRDQVIMDLSKGKDYNEAYHSVNQDDVDREYNRQKMEAHKSGENLIFDLTHMTENSRNRTLSGIPKEYKRIGVVFLTSYEELQRRNQERAKKENKHISERVLTRMLGDFQFPLYDEFDEIHYIFSDDKK